MKKITVIVPVYNAPKVVDHLLRSIEIGSNWDLVEEILIGNDGSDNVTSDLLKEYLGRIPSLKIINREKNLGFIENVNDLYSRCKTDYVILLNSDVIVPAGWLERTLKALESGPDVALACPLTTNATNLTLKPAPGHSWSDVDDILQTFPPYYPDCRPAVGFFLGIKRQLLPETYLLDPTYHLGYWEDTDLHFRVASRGHRAVVIDNLFVFHRNHSPSFSIENNLGEINDINLNIFMSRWEKEFAAMKELNAEFNHISRFSAGDLESMRYAGRLHKNVLFVLADVLPGDSVADSVMRLVDELNLSGVKASTLCCGRIDYNFLHLNYQHVPLTSLEEALMIIRDIDIVFMTRPETYELTRKISSSYKSNFYCFTQVVDGKAASRIRTGKGEGAFPGPNQSTTDLLPLERSISRCEVALARIPVGPSRLDFYPDGRIARNERAIVAFLEEGSSESAGVLQANLEAAQQAGFDIHLFGSWNNWDVSKGATWHGFHLPQELRKLFSSVGYFLDCSAGEELGLYALKAAFCGCVPILLNEQRLSGFAQDGQNCIKLPEDRFGPNFYAGLNQKVIFDRLSKGAQELRNTASLEGAVRLFSNELAASQRKAVLKEVFDFESKKNAAECARLRAECEEIRAELQRVRAQLDLNVERIEGMLTSTSWKVTAPLRRLRQLFSSKI